MHLPSSPPAVDARLLYDFVESRITRGMFVHSAFSRAARVISALGRPRAPDVERERPAPMSRLKVSRVPFGQAAAFCAVYHRHLDPPVGHMYSLGVFCGRRLVGVAIVGRPVARLLDDGATLEITRVAVDGTRNACSALLGAARREAHKRGIGRIVTYTLPGESGSSLRAAGFRPDGNAGGGKWARRGRPRVDGHPQERKLRWLG